MGKPDHFEIVAQQGNPFLRRADQRKHHRNRKVRGEQLEIKLALGGPFVEQARDGGLHQGAHLVGEPRGELGGESIAQELVLVHGQRDQLLLGEAAPGGPLLPQQCDNILVRRAQLVIAAEQLAHGLVLGDHHT